jgi:hypothetical protein
MLRITLCTFLALGIACADPGASVDTATLAGPDSGAPGEAECADAVDNDGDGAQDCDDADCATAAACGEPSPGVAYSGPLVGSLESTEGMFGCEGTATVTLHDDGTVSGTATCDFLADDRVLEGAITGGWTDARFEGTWQVAWLGVAREITIEGNRVGSEITGTIDGALDDWSVVGELWLTAD